MDCLEALKLIDDKVALILTDIPYGEVNKKTNGLRKAGALDKGDANLVTFNIEYFVRLCCEKCYGSIYIFCGTEQVSSIRKTMVECGLSTRLCILEKTNPSPMNGQNIWLSGVECCVFGKHAGATFNAKCRNTVWRYPCQRNKLHPTQKPLELFIDLIQVSSNEGDTVLDPCIGSGTTALAAYLTKRNYIGVDLNPNYIEIVKQRLKTLQG